MATLTSADYVLVPSNGPPYYAIKIKDGASPTWSEADSDGYYEEAIQIKGFWAYSSDLPGDVKQAAIRLALWFYAQRTVDMNAERPIVTADGVTVMPASIPADVAQILNRYKRRAFA
jgi:hypothetical protein